MAKIIYYFLTLLMLSSCATTHRTENFNSASVSSSDSTHQDVRGGVGQSYIHIDSLVSSYLQQSVEKQVSNDSTSEQITESIISYIDSLGREVRQEQRVINRKESHSQEQLYQHQLTQLQHQLTMQQEHYDSLFQSLYENKKSLNTDSINYAATKEVSPVSRSRFIPNLLCIIVAVSVIFFGIRLYRKIMNT